MWIFWGAPQQVSGDWEDRSVSAFLLRSRAQHNLRVALPGHHLLAAPHQRGRRLPGEGSAGQSAEAADPVPAALRHRVLVPEARPVSLGVRCPAPRGLSAAGPRGQDSTRNVTCVFFCTPAASHMSVSHPLHQSSLIFPQQSLMFGFFCSDFFEMSFPSLEISLVPPQEIKSL